MPTEGLQRLLHAQAQSQDPTRTGRIRRDYEREIKRRIREVIREMQKAIVEENALGIDKVTIADEIIRVNRFEFKIDPTRVTAFMDWFRGKLDEHVLGGTDSAAQDGRFWGNSFTNTAYRRGLISASGAVSRAGGKVARDYVENAMLRGKHMQTIRQVSARSYQELKDITSRMADQIGQSIADALASGRNPVDLAKKMAGEIEGLSSKRAALIARTETIAAYNEAELNSFEEAGISDVGLEVELVTAGDNRVCERCNALAGNTYTVQAARGILPVHPNCRCAWAPVIPEGKELNLS